MTESAQSQNTPKKRSWFQFGTRTLLVLTLISAIGCMWFRGKMQKAERQREIYQSYSPYVFSYDYEWKAHQAKMNSRAASNSNSKTQTTWREPRPPYPDLMLYLLGRDFLCDIHAAGIIEVYDYEKDHSEKFLESCVELKELRYFLAFPFRGGDEQLAKYADHVHLESLRLGLGDTTEDGLRHLKNMKQLKHLQLGRLKLTWKGLRHLQQLPKLEVLEIELKQLTENELHEFKSLQHLKLLDNYDLVVSKKQFNDLQQALPYTILDFEISGVVPVSQIPEKPE